ncbi:MAG: IS1380 family transposase [Pseudomonadota bacterium]
MTNCTASHRCSHRLNRRSIDINFSGGDVSAIGGVELLSAADRQLGLSQAVANALPDPRNQSLVTHRWEALLRQRMFAIAAGLADLNDHDQLRLDAALQTAVGSMDTLASPATLCRLEANAERSAIVAMHRILLDQFIAKHETAPTSLILDFDGTDDRVYGEQQGRAFSTHYGGYGFFPLYVYCGEHLLTSYLRPINRSDAYHAAAVLKLVVSELRRHWPGVRIVMRADTGFYRPLLLSWCERHSVEYIIGYARNKRLERLVATEVKVIAGAWEQIEDTQTDLDGIKLFDDIRYQADSWRNPRRIIAKLEHNALGSNQRFIVTSLAGDAEQLYSEVYCERGEMENRHKELQMGLFADRTSCTAWWSNQLRVMLSSFAYVLMHHIRKVGLAGTKLARVQVWTLRQRLIWIGAVVLRNTRRIELRLSSACLEKTTLLTALRRLEGT